MFRLQYRAVTSCASLKSLRLRRGYSNAGVVELAYLKSEPPSGASGDIPPLVILHGLFGHKQNWRSLSRSLAKTLRTDVYALDLRNHGTSPHNREMKHSNMAADVMHFFDTHDLNNVHLIGHSMGGKVASVLALHPDLPPNTLSSLTVADVTPTRFSISEEFSGYLKAMKAVEAANVDSSAQAYKVLDTFNIDLPMQQFLLTNLGSGTPRRFRIPLDILHENLREIGDFPYEPDEVSWSGPTLFVRGIQSDYVKEKHFSTIKAYFPNVILKSLDTGHNVHAEKPTDFLEILTGFIRDPSSLTSEKL